MERFASGSDDGLRVEVIGRVRQAHQESQGLWRLILANGGQRFEVYVRAIRPGLDPVAAWIAASVRVRGVLAVDYQLQRRGLAQVRVFVVSSDDVTIEQAEQIDPFSVEPLPLSRIGQYRRELAPGQRSRVRGVVVARPGTGTLAIEDQSGGLLLRTRDAGEFKPGDAVEAVGFEATENYLPILEDARVTRLPAPLATPAAVRIPLEELATGRRHACLISLEGKLLEQYQRPNPAPDAEKPGREAVMILQHDDTVFTASYPLENPAVDMLPIEPGSLVDVTGLCLTLADPAGKLTSFRMQLTDARGIRLLRPAPWMNQQRLRLALLSTFAGLTICAGWILSFSRKNRLLRQEIREREKLTAELQAARDKLSARVDARTEQLHRQINARKDSELHFKGVLEERTRLAQELHDGLQQGLTGVALQLDAAVKLRERNPGMFLHHVELARSLINQTHVDLRNSIWNLRSRSHEKFSLLDALKQSSLRITEGTDVSVTVTQAGEPRDLGESEIENLLRIAQESLTNALKHAHASHIEIHIHYTPDTLILQVRDDGTGFVRDPGIRPESGHFGLSGMAERARRLGGTFSIQSSPGNGTVIEAKVPLPAEPRPAPPEPLTSNIDTP
jgi:signal transduction histidine kinase